MKLTIDLKNYTDDKSVFKRTAARGIIRKGDHYLLIYSKYGDYKFPGGGKKDGETLEETLIREIQEETGFQVISDSVKEYGTVFERRKGEFEDIVEMKSHYFICDVQEEAGARHLDEYEEEYDYQVVWMTLQEAMERNKLVSNLEVCPWVIRDTRVMEYLNEEAGII